MKTSILTLVLLVLGAVCVQAQEAKNTKPGLALGIGAAANYYYGPGSQNFDDFDNERLNYQLNGMLGITLLRDNNDHRTMLAGFGTFGLNKASTLNQIFDDQNYLSLALDQSNRNNFYKLEGGLLIAEVLRVSTGVGQQVFNEQTLVSEDGINLQTTSLKYYSSTIGFNIKLSAIALTVDCNFNYGKDYNKAVIIPSAGLMFQF